MEGEKKKNKSHGKKAKIVKSLAEQIKKARTLMIVGIKNLPSRQFQEIKKAIRKDVLIKIAKKNILMKSIESLKKESVLPLEKNINENCAFAISNLEGFELAGILSKNKNPIFAKTRQIAPEDIEIKAGLTNLMPGPAISELGSLGIQIAIEEGKISIKQPKIIVRKNQEISESVASILQKLEIKPFKIGMVPISFYDIQTEKIYSDINIDSEEAVKDLRESAGKALGFAKKIAYYCRETIGYLLAKANSHGSALGKLRPKEDKPTEGEIKEEE